MKSFLIPSHSQVGNEFQMRSLLGDVQEVAMSYIHSDFKSNFPQQRLLLSQQLLLQAVLHKYRRGGRYRGGGGGGCVAGARYEPTKTFIN